MLRLRQRNSCLSKHQCKRAIDITKGQELLEHRAAEISQRRRMVEAKSTRDNRQGRNLGAEDKNDQ